MKNKKFTFVALAVAAIATSCSNDGLADGSSQSSASGKAQSVELTASLNDDNGTDTRVGMTKENSNKASFYWHKDEAILVQTVSGSNYSGVKFTTSEETGATTATFNGNISEGSLGSYAVYPYNENHKFTSATDLTYYLPATYTYNKVESNVFSKTESTTTYPENSTNIPLVGKIANGKIAFKHIGGLAVIRIDQMPAAEGTLTVTADQQLSGNFTISDLSANEPKIETTTASDDNGKVTFTFSNASTTSAGVFYLPLATGSYSNVKITVASSGNTTSSTVDYGTLDVARASVTAVPLYNNGGTIVKYIDKSCEINGHKFIDLGLSVLWAETNVGADKASDYGDFYAWGETESKQSYTSYNYTYSDNPETLGATYDAATANWQSPCRMPTKEEFEELIDNCTWKWTTENSISGYKVIGKKSGNSIFLPASGYREDEATTDQGEYGYYWSSTLNQDWNGFACCLKFYNGVQVCPVGFREIGYAVRPVAK